MRRVRFFLWILGFSLCWTTIAFAALTVADLNKDLAYYRKTAQAQKLNPNNRLYILNRIREKYKDADFDQTDLYAEIDKCSGERQSAPPKEAKQAQIQPPAGKLSRALVLEGKETSVLQLDVQGLSEYKEVVARDEKNLQPPVLVLYLKNVQDKLRPSARNFSLKTGAIRQVQSKTVSGKPPTVKVSIALREDTPYSISQESNRLTVTFKKTGETSVPVPAAIAPTSVVPGAMEFEKEPPADIPAPSPLTEISTVTLTASVDEPAEPGAIEPGDVLSILVTPAQELSRIAVVQPNGILSLPPAGNFEAGGSYVGQLEHDIEARLADFAPNPKVKITVEKAAPKQIFITGQIKNPGSYAAVQPLTCFEFISRMAGGFQNDADRKNVTIYRATNKERKRIRFNAEEFLISADPTKDVPLLPGDVVEVPADTQFVFVTGGVKNPGRYALKKGMKLMEAVYLAGGFADQAKTNQVRIIREDQGKKMVREVDTRKLLKDPELDAVLTEGDVVLVSVSNHPIRRKIFTKSAISWMSFFASLGIVLILLV